MSAPFLVSVSVPQSITTGRVKAAFDAAMGVGPADGVVLYWVGDRPRVATDEMGTRIASWLLLVDSLTGSAAQRVANEVAQTTQEQLSRVATGVGSPDAMPVNSAVAPDMISAWEDGTALTGAEPDSGAGSGGGVASTGGHGTRTPSQGTTITTTTPARSASNAIGVALLAGFGVYAAFTVWRSWRGPQADRRPARSSRRGRGGRGASRG